MREGVIKKVAPNRKAYCLTCLKKRILNKADEVFSAQGKMHGDCTDCGLHRDIIFIDIGEIPGVDLYEVRLMCPNEHTWSIDCYGITSTPATELSIRVKMEIPESERNCPECVQSYDRFGLVVLGEPVRFHVRSDMA